MGKVTFANSKVNETISGESQKYRSHITSAGVFDTGSLAAEVAENLKDSAAYVETVLREATNVSKKHLAIGERVTIDGLCRLEIGAEGAAPSEDSPWDPAANKLVVNAIAYDGVKFAAVPGGIAKGAYVLEVTTFGLVGETTPRVFRKPVTLVEAIPAPPPAPTARIDRIEWVDGKNNKELKAGEEIVVIGENLVGEDGFIEGDSLTLTVKGVDYPVELRDPILTNEFSGYWPNGITDAIVGSGVTDAKATVVSHSGVAGSAPQTLVVEGIAILPRG